MKRLVFSSVLVLGFFPLPAAQEGAEEKQPPDDQRQFLVGGDISALAAIEKAGGVFRDRDAPGDAIDILVRHGCNCLRLRLFVDPPHRNVVVNDLPYTLDLARRIKKAGAKLLLDFHYSDSWADPGKQRKPKAWEKLDFPSLEKKVYEYTRESIAAFRREDVLPDMVQIGNEIAPGILWPDGKLHGVGEPDTQWEKFSRLLKAGVRGVREATREKGEEKKVRIVLHIHGGGDWNQTKWFFENIEKRDVPYDVIGLSYYPWWHGTMEDLRDNLHRASARFGKDVFVVETAYLHQNRNPGGRGDDAMRWPRTPAGQKAFLEELVRTVRSTPEGRGLGVLWWYPESIPVRGLGIWMGGAAALFDRDGRPLPALSVFSEASARR